MIVTILLLFLVAQLHPKLLWPHGLWPTGLLCPWDFPGKNSGVGCQFLLQGIFPTQGLNRNFCVSCIVGRFFTTEPPRKPCHHFTSDEIQA